MIEPTSSAVDDPTGEPASPGIGLALSGGGVRATLFSLGVAIALIETGANQWVRSITSVSGGSLLNAWLAHAGDFASMESPAGFQAGKLARMLSHGGVFAWSPLNIGKVIGKAIGLIPSMVGAAVALATVASLLEKEERPAFVDVGIQNMVRLVGLVPPLAWLYVAVTLAVFLMFLLRGRWQEAIFAVKLGELTGTSRNKLTDFATSNVQHVLVSTDLHSGCPVYFSKDFVHCEHHGWSEPRDLRTAAALYASAAFPVVFPPRRLRVKDFEFRNGKAGELPDLALADGGVYNNLGDDWFDERENQVEAYSPYGALPLDPDAVREPIHTRIIVNAGAPSQPITRLYPGMTTLRTMSVLYDNTVRPRVAQIPSRHGLLLDIKYSPRELADGVGEPPGPKADRAKRIAKHLGKREEQFWAQLKEETAGTPTKLSGAGWRTAAALMHHGYLSAVVLLWTEYGESLPRLKQLRDGKGAWPLSPEDPFRLKDEKYFLDLARGAVDTESKKPATAPAPAA